VSAARVISQHQRDSLSITSEAVQFISDERFVAVAKGHGTDFDELHTHQAEGIAENHYPIGGRPGHYRLRKFRRTELHQQELKAFEEILLTSRAKFVAMADTILRDKEDAEDAVQNAFLSAYLHFRSFEGRSALKTLADQNRPKCRADASPPSETDLRCPSRESRHRRRWHPANSGLTTRSRKDLRIRGEFSQDRCGTRKNESNAATGICNDLLRRNVEPRSVRGTRHSNLQIERPSVPG
jgi:hypothetical protein